MNSIFNITNVIYNIVNKSINNDSNIIDNYYNSKPISAFVPTHNDKDELFDMYIRDYNNNSFYNYPKNTEYNHIYEIVKDSLIEDIIIAICNMSTLYNIDLLELYNVLSKWSQGDKTLESFMKLYIPNNKTNFKYSLNKWVRGNSQSFIKNQISEDEFIEIMSNNNFNTNYIEVYPRGKPNGSNRYISRYNTMSQVIGNFYYNYLTRYMDYKFKEHITTYNKPENTMFIDISKAYQSVKHDYIIARLFIIAKNNRSFDPELIINYDKYCKSLKYKMNIDENGKLYKQFCSKNFNLIPGNNLSRTMFDLMVSGIKCHYRYVDDIVIDINELNNTIDAINRHGLDINKTKLDNGYNNNGYNNYSDYAGY